MGTPIGTVEWLEKNEKLNELLKQETALTTHEMKHGFEAEVIKISSDEESFVLKTWSKGSKPDIQFQYHLLNALFERGLSVSRPVAWGIDPNGDKVLLTTFDGGPILKLNGKKMADIAKILSSIHRIRVEELEQIQLPKYDFIGYFFPGVREHPDLAQALEALVEKTPITQEHIIHGDFHLANFLEENGRYTVIDWTNGQLGDPRYDFAWSLALINIYVSERNAEAFRNAYLLENEMDREELEAFEALACIRWLLLNRSGGTPKGPSTMSKVKSLVMNNRYLSELGLKEFSVKR